MSKHKQNNEGQNEGNAGTYETFYEDDREGSSGRSWNFNAAGAVCGVLGGLRDTVLKAMPVEVTEHLINGEKEIIKAGIAMAECQMRTADNLVNRARDLKKEKSAE